MGLRRVRIDHASLFFAVLMGCATATCQTGTDLHPLGVLSNALIGETDVAAAKYVGPGSCSASACHGNIRPMSKTKVWQNEYSTWITSDKHAHAYRALQEPLGKQIGAILKLRDLPENSPRCLVCHALSVPPGAHARDFDIAEGVSCESCHGPASLWLEPHIEPTAKHMDLVERLHLYDNKNLEKRAEKCLSCHLGTPGVTVDHELIAAGHPDLTFELDSFSAVMPRHWKVNREQDQWIGVQSWAIGQAVQLREALNRLSRRAAGPSWPDYAELDCFACHHALTAPTDSWRLTTTDYYRGRRPGVPAWNASRYIVFRWFVGVVDPEGGRRLDAAVNNVSELIGKWATPQQISTAAHEAAGVTEEVLQNLKAQQYSQDLTNSVTQGPRAAAA